MIYVFDVDFSADKDALKTGRIVTGTARVSILATTPHGARLAAEQMVFATGREPTAARLIEQKER